MTEHPAGSLNGLLGYLADTQAPVVVVGGMAVIVHGYVRAMPRPRPSASRCRSPASRS